VGSQAYCATHQSVSQRFRDGHDCSPMLAAEPSGRRDAWIARDPEAGRHPGACVEVLTFGRASSTNLRLNATLRDSLPRMTQPIVSICVVTYRRPAGLARLLAGIARLRFNTAVAPKLEIVVVDNDQKCSAVPVCAEMSARLSCPISYEVEPRRHISYAAGSLAGLAGMPYEEYRVTHGS
jgi:hypothetical protein